MKLLDYMRENGYGTVLTIDDDSKVEVRFYDDNDTRWDKAQLVIASKLEVLVDAGPLVTVDFSGAIRNCRYQLESENLFNTSDTEEIVNLLPYIFDHNVSEYWLTIFAWILAENN